MDGDEDVRRMLSGAAMRNEKEHRDLIGPAVEIVLHRRRLMRTYGAAGSGLMVAAGATVAIWLSGSSTEARPVPAASSTPTVSAAPPTGQTVWDKNHDISSRLPGILNPLLPKGLSVVRSTSQVPNSGYQLVGPTGSNDFSLTSSPKGQRNRAMEEGGCVVGGVCSQRTVPGGTLYIQTKNFTADYGGNSGYAPGTGKQVLTVNAEYEFLPAAADGHVVDVALATTVSHEQYAARAPKDWGDAPWPPPAQPNTSFNASGALLSPDDFMALISKPGFSAVSTLLDPDSPVDQATLERHKTADATIAAAVKPILPPGLTLAISNGSTGAAQRSELVLTGPSGANLFSWQARPQVKTWQHGFACERHTQENCTWKEVPGGEVQVVHTSGSMQALGGASHYADGQTSAVISGGDVYTYLPDDPNGTVIELSTGEQIRDIPWAATRPTDGTYADPSKAWPPPARTGEAFNAGGSLISLDQFAAMMRTPGIADVVKTVNRAVDPLSGDSIAIFD
ncbi:hypothetical protein GCM10009838_63330 [Catenulispora subtropica]|uniref:Uncharacterized protein n=2 Tax=Catenulispora subtropica TaxID=450798 RepID=A0ABN2SRG0_9ACTN